MLDDFDRPKHYALAAKRRAQCTNHELRLEFDGFPLVVRGDYQPEEHATFHSAGGSPGCPAYFDVTEVYLRDSAIEATTLFDCEALKYAVLAEIDQQSEHHRAEAQDQERLSA